MMVCLAVLDNKNDKISIYKVMALAVMILTLRSGILAIVAIYAFVAFSKKRKIRWYSVVEAALLAVVVGWGMIQEYFVSQRTLRYVLLENGFKLFKRFFPLGAGFATYGSQMSYNYYSKLYYELGFNNVWGLNQINGNYINDNYWPMIMAQFGLFGVIFNIILFIYEYKLLNKYAQKISTRNIALVLFINLMISTTASANMTGVAGMLIYFTLVLLLRQNNDLPSKEIVLQ